MRPLTEEETKTFFAKLAKYLGRNITTLLDNNFCFRLHKDRVYYMSEELLKYSNSVNNKQLISVGTCFGKFTQSGKFRLAITALPELVQFAKYKVWVKPNGEMSYMYGNHILKAHLGKITEDCPQHQGVIILTMADIPIVTIY
jgi:60S ribosome subunit biogenesis protein NIP7